MLFILSNIFTIVIRCQQHQCLLTDEWINSVVYVYNMILFIRKKELDYAT